jgi:hypothetical protein
MIMNGGVGNDLEGGGHDLFEGITQNLLGRRGKLQNSCQDS